MANPHLSDTGRHARVGYWVQWTAVAVTAMLSVYGFVLKDIIRPSQEPTALNVSASLRDVGSKGTLELVQASISAVNPSRRRIYVPALWYIVVGVCVEPVHAPPLASLRETLRYVQDDEQVCSFARNSSCEILAQERIAYDKDIWWEPNDRTNNEPIIPVPRGRFDYVAITVKYAYTRSISDLDSMEWRSDDDGEWTAAFKLKPSVRMTVDAWQNKTASGFNWYETSLVLDAPATR